MRYCCVPHCTGEGGFLFPRNKTVRAKWIIAVRREGLALMANTGVCRAHFREEDYNNDLSWQGR